jgi:molybdate transport system substrate-binding protein
MIRSNGTLVRWGHTLCGALLALQLGCPRNGAPRTDLVVLAAASLSEVFREIGRAFETTHGGRVLLSFAGSQTVATQLREGVQADVIAVADPAILAELARQGLVEAPSYFASTRLVWALRRAPDGGSLGDPADLADSDWALVLAVPEVPAGAYARRALDALGLRQVAEAHLVSHELDVRGVVAKLRLAGADLGLVYATDVSLEDPELEVVELPQHAQIVARYPAARVRGLRNPSRGQAFLEFLHGPEAGAILRRAGFGAP